MAKGDAMGASLGQLGGGARGMSNMMMPSGGGFGANQQMNQQIPNQQMNSPTAPSNNFQNIIQRMQMNRQQPMQQQPMQQLQMPQPLEMRPQPQMPMDQILGNIQRPQNMQPPSGAMPGLGMQDPFQQQQLMQQQAPPIQSPIAPSNYRPNMQPDPNLPTRKLFGAGMEY